MKTAFTARFKKSFARLPENIQNKTLRHIRFLAADLRHPGVKAKKMTSVGDIWEGQVDRSYRLTFEIEGDTLIFRRVGGHDVLRKP